MLPWAFEPGMGFERWVDYALDVPMYFVKRGDHYIDVAGQSFRDLMAGKLAALPGERATISIGPTTSPRFFPRCGSSAISKMRGADGGPWRRLPALPAFWVGLLYDDDALDAAWDLVKDWTAEERQNAARRRAEAGLHARPSAAAPMLQLAQSDAGACRDAGLRAGAGSILTGPRRRPLSAAAPGVSSRAASRRPRSCWRSFTARGAESVEPVFREYAY